MITCNFTKLTVHIYYDLFLSPEDSVCMLYMRISNVYESKNILHKKGVIDVYGIKIKDLVHIWFNNYKVTKEKKETTEPKDHRVRKEKKEELVSVLFMLSFWNLSITIMAYGSKLLETGKLRKISAKSS